MAKSETGEWRDLFDVALFEPSKSKLRQRIERARKAINSRLDALITEQSENPKTMPEHIALCDALATLAELHKTVYARRPAATDSGHRGGVAG